MAMDQLEEIMQKSIELGKSIAHHNHVPRI